MKFEFDVKKDVEYSLESKKIDLEFFCKLNELTRKTIYNQTQQPNNFKTLNKIYNGIYDLGIRLNKIKAEIYQETASEKNIILFHGSKYGLDEITHDGSRSDCDFGSGFYLTKSYESALSFVESYIESSIYAFSLNTEKLNIVELDTSIEWMILICHYRKQTDIASNYKQLLEKIENADVIVAPIADNKMFEILNEFENGLITTVQALHALSASRLGKQYVIKSEKAKNELIKLNQMFICSKEKDDSKSKSQERANEIDTKIFYAKREFRNQGKYIDELLK